MISFAATTMSCSATVSLNKRQIACIKILWMQAWFSGQKLTVTAVQSFMLMKKELLDHIDVFRSYGIQDGTNRTRARTRAAAEE